MADTNTILPPSIVQAYFDSPPQIELLGQGEINATYLVKIGGQKVILQRLSSIFKEGVIKDFDTVTAHLKQEGWEVPRIVKAKSGELYSRDEQGELWRAMTFIASDEKKAAATFGDFGELLGKLHASLAKLDYTLKFKIPHFHDTDYYAKRLAEVQDQLSQDDKPVATHLLDAYEALPELPAWPDQLLHGDPRTNNMLFRAGKPFTYIDFDTVMLGPVWLDLGDLLRSLAEDSHAKEGTVSLEQLTQVVEKYRLKTHPDVQEKQFRAWSLVALQKIALELAMRYMIDIVEDYYFTWDAKAFGSRRASHLSRVNQQLQIYEAVK